MKWKTLVGVGTVVFALGSATTSNAAVITFDGVADGTVINSLYPGLTFSNPLSPYDIYARTLSGGNNVVSVFAAGYPGFDGRWGAVDVAFANPQTFVSIDVTPIAPPEGLGPVVAKPYLQAFNGSTLLGTVYYTGPLPVSAGPGAATETLSFSGTAITGIRFTSQPPGGTQPVYGLFDNLTYTVDGGNDGGDDGGNPVPEPGSMLLIGMGLTFVAAGRRWMR